MPYFPWYTLSRRNRSLLAFSNKRYMAPMAAHRIWLVRLFSVIRRYRRDHGKYDGQSLDDFLFTFSDRILTSSVFRRRRWRFGHFTYSLARRRGSGLGRCRCERPTGSRHGRERLYGRRRRSRWCWSRCRRPSWRSWRSAGSAWRQTPAVTSSWRCRRPDTAYSMSTVSRPGVRRRRDERATTTRPTARDRAGTGIGRTPGRPERKLEHNARTCIGER